MAPEEPAPTQADSAEARIAAILRETLPPAEDGLADEISRLMLHLSREPLDEVAPPSAANGKARSTLLARLFGRRGR